jgi:hypothetical protein
MSKSQDIIDELLMWFFLRPNRELTGKQLDKLPKKLRESLQEVKSEELENVRIK